MKPSRSRRASVRALLLLGSLQFSPTSVHARSPERDRSTQLQAARAAFDRLLRLSERAESRRGGRVALAKRQAETSGAKISAAWLDWLPDFSVAVRRQVAQNSDADSGAPRWRLDFEAQVALSLQKLSATSIAQAAHEKAQSELQQAAYSTRERTLRAGFDLYFSERKAELLKDQIGALESLVSGLTQTSRAGPTSDSVLVEGYLSELRGTLAELEVQQRDFAQRLAGTLDFPVATSGIEPGLGLPILLELIRTELGESSPSIAAIRRADIELEEQRLRWADSQTWYAPELRSTTLAQLPRGQTADSSSIHLTAITTELALGLRLRPGVPALQAAQRRALAKSRFDDRQSRWEREQIEDQARIRLEEGSRLWRDEAGIRLAGAELDDAKRRFARGERSVAELAAASRNALAAQLARELILSEAVLAQITLSANDRTGLASSGQVRRDAVAPAELDRRSLRWLDSVPLVKSARAEAERATERARSERFALTTALEAGVALPLYETGDVRLSARPELALTGSGSLTTPVRETSVLGRWSVDFRASDSSRRAFESEARLRQAQAELERKRYQWAQLAARLELAEAQKNLELCQRSAQLALESLQREQRWFEQGAASERDLRAAQLSHQIANVAQGKSAARLRGAEILLGNYLGASRGTRLTVQETPEALERWLSERFLAENGLIGFESSGRQREAELAAESAHAQAESLAKPARSATFTTQATQGLRGGAFSLTFALGIAFDPPHDALQATRAAEREGAARGRLASLVHELDEQRAKVQQSIAQANALLDAEDTIRQRLSGLQDAVHAQQAETPDVHDAVKQRQLVELQAARLDSERRRVEADEQRRAAQLRALALGDTRALPAASRKSSLGTLDETVRALIEQRAEVATADAAAAAAGKQQPVPVASALHLVGPFAVGSYSANRITGPQTSKIWREDLGVGLAVGLDESLAFLGTRELSSAAGLERHAARQNAALRAIHQLGLAWTARELERLSKQREEEARRHLEGSVQPRFGLGQVTAATVIDAQQRHAFARLQHASDESLLLSQYASLATLGTKVGDSTLDEYQRRGSAWLSNGHAEATLPTSGEAPSSAELAARSRSAAASAAASASALRLISPVTGLVELRPAQLETTIGTDAARETSSSEELLWVFSLIVPVKPKELGALSVALAQARESDEELGTAARSARLLRSGLQVRLVALEQARASATTRRLAAERALRELDRRFHAAEDHTSIDEVAPARQALFDARRAEIISNGAALEACLLLRAIQEHR